ncbi:ANTAR domain-containing response regulator [Pseudobacteroides cellulosolvens]|uniref:ANTAR domain-containing protein n=1 Tax=Pseudobacteroides cellulosolvens ATCC 35603 = DSM 2933 TaxID=398512 RepID=A0A0L6JW07_9FIRM|nr:ANTAR domain-containing protein [Pseudobacteroides cellulosolvens]KNY30051.1 ANTAR domain protein with unknown sensor [Pseudobacteroides cellulosolvens ATCC 35603 = DSM 2933]
MDCSKFIISGEDKRTLTLFKNILVSSGHVFIGYLKEPTNLLRCIRTNVPDFIIVEATNDFSELKRVLEIIDDEILAACVVVMNTKNDKIIEFIKGKRVLSYITKPVYEEPALQVIDMSLLNYSRIIEYERKVKKLNETLESRKIVEKAKWILVQKDGYTEEAAYEVIRRKSRDNRIPMKEIAEALILTKG